MVGQWGGVPYIYIYIYQTQSLKVPTPYKLPNPEPYNEKLLFHPGDWELGLGAFGGLHA